MTGYTARTEILETLQEELKTDSLKKGRVLVLGRDPDLKENTIHERVKDGRNDFRTDRPNVISLATPFKICWRTAVSHEAKKTNDTAGQIRTNTVIKQTRLTHPSLSKSSIA